MTSCNSQSVQKPRDQSISSSNTDGSFLPRRRTTHPLLANVRATFTHNNSSKNSSVKQRVLSAKLLKMRNIQSQLNVANFYLDETKRENIALKTINQRQEKALSKYEGTAADLPRILQSHSEEVRALTEKNKTLRKAIRDLTDHVKLRDEELLTTRKQIEHLEKLSKNRHLGERQKLSEQVEDLKQKLESTEKQITLLNKKLFLEEKSSKHKFSIENIKHKECQRKLMQALAEIERLTALVDVNNVNANKREDRLIPLRKKNSERDSRSIINLDETYTVQLNTGKHSDESFVRELPNGISTKRKSITTRAIQGDSLLDNNGEVKYPTENIMNRLSSRIDEIEKQKKALDYEAEKDKNNTRPSSTQRLERISNNVESLIERTKENGTTQLDKKIGDYCNHVLETVKNCNHVVKTHQDGLEQSKNDTEILREAVDEVKALDDQLKRDSIFSMDAEELKKMLKPEKIELSLKEEKAKMKNGKKLKKHPKADELLAQLKAIDKGDYIDNFDTSADEIYDSLTS